MLLNKRSTIQAKETTNTNSLAAEWEGWSKGFSQPKQGQTSPAILRDPALICFPPRSSETRAMYHCSQKEPVWLWVCETMWHQFLQTEIIDQVELIHLMLGFDW